MANTYEVLVIGGGASGLFTMIELIKNGVKNAVLLERADRVGKKLIATGNGQGNLYNANLTTENFHSKTPSFFVPAITDFDEKEYEDFLLSLGVKTEIDEEGRAYPISRQASSVLDYMRFFLEKNNALIYTNAFVNSIKKDGNEFVVGTVSGITYRSKRVVLATGGTASKSFGTDGNGYSLVKKLGHSITELNPALVRLKTDDAITKTLKNLKALVRATLFDNGKKIKSVVGEVLFTDFGLSGNAIFSLSSYAVRVKNPKISLEFLPNLTYDEVVKIIDLRFSLGYIKNEDILTGLVQKMIGRAIIKNAQEFTSKALAKSLKNFEFNITGTFGFDNAQVTSGGVDVDFVNPRAMESKIVKNLYLIGEILDVDGDCGGYNLQWAFSSAKTATNDIIKKIGIK